MNVDIEAPAATGIGNQGELLKDGGGRNNELRRDLLNGCER